MDKRKIDRLSIISMKGIRRKGRQYLDFSSSWLGNMIENEKPDIMFLPGHNVDISSTILQEYQSARVKHNNDAVLLYDTKRLQLETNHEKNSHQPSIQTYEADKIIFPVVNVLSPRPTSNVIKSFHCITWHSELLQDIENPHQYAWRFLGLAQQLAWTNGVEVLIGGDFNLSVQVIKQLLVEHNKLVEKSIDDIKPFFREIGYMDCMTENIHRPGRRLRQLKLHECKVDPNTQETEYFVASKEMKLCNTNFLNSAQCPVICGPKKVLHSSTQNYSAERCSVNTTRESVKQTYCSMPAKTEMCIPATPTKHSGG